MIWNIKQALFRFALKHKMYRLQGILLWINGEMSFKKAFRCKSNKGRRNQWIRKII